MREDFNWVARAQYKSFVGKCLCKLDDRAYLLNLLKRYCLKSNGSCVDRVAFFSQNKFQVRSSVIDERMLWIMNSVERKKDLSE